MPTGRQPESRRRVARNHIGRPHALVCAHLLRHNLHLTCCQESVFDAFSCWACASNLHPLLCVVLLSFTLPTWAAEKARLRVDDYQIDAELMPHLHKIVAHAKVKFTALDDLTVASFELHNDLRVTKVADAAGKPLAAERVTQDSTVRVQLADGLAKNASTSLTFDYEGTLDSADNSPVQGLKAGLHRR